MLCGGSHHLKTVARAYLIIASLIIHSSLTALICSYSFKIACKLSMNSLPNSGGMISNTKARIKKIALIGAGAAGIITSDVLLSNSFEVTVFEKSDAVGGVWDYRSEGNYMNG